MKIKKKTLLQFAVVTAWKSAGFPIISCQDQALQDMRLSEKLSKFKICANVRSCSSSSRVAWQNVIFYASMATISMCTFKKVIFVVSGKK
jgi:hypothetical protein